MVMASPGSSVFILCMFIFSVSVVRSDFYNVACGRDNKVNYTSTSIYKRNLDTALTTLISAAKKSNSGFYNASVGEGLDQVNALVYCRRDVQPDICRSCVKDSMNKLRELCPSTKEADIWYDECILRYSNGSIFYNVETWPTVYMQFEDNATDVIQFNKDLNDLLDKLKGRAAQEKFATGNVTGEDVFSTIYGLMQCSPDLSSTQCTICIDQLKGLFPSCCSGKIRGHIFNPSCDIRYETYRFYNETLVNAPPPQFQLPLKPPSVPPPGKVMDPSAYAGKDDSNKRMIIIIVVVIVGFVMLLFVLVWVVKRKREQRKYTGRSRSCISVSWSKYIIHSCGTSGNYTSNSTYEKNLDRALATLSIAANLSNSGFYNASVGEDQDRVNTIVLCRKDFQPDVCRSCANDSIIMLKELCPDQNEAVGWYDECTLRYSNRVILNNIETLPAWSYYNSESATDVAQFDQDLQKLLSNLKVQAAGKKFATGNVSGPDFLTIWGLMQCTPDLSSTQCSDCLDTVTEQIPLCCSGKIGRQIFNPSCKLIYDIRHFFNEISPVNAPPPRQQLSPPSPPSVIPGRDKNTKRTVLRTAVVVSGLAMLLIVLFCIFRRKAKHRINTETVHHGSVEDIISIESFQYDFGMVESATKSFSDSNKLGEGGFGAVYKGTLENGQEVAVKRLSSGSVQGEQEFKNEIILVARLQHRNLVRLLGFSFKGTERLLIYEFVPNASLDHLIFDPEKRSSLDWEKRYKIIGGVARGILYLHEDSRLRIIHRDLKAGNILLDGEMNPKIADFGMARLFDLDETQGMTNRIVGTYGYMAPEYALYGQFSVKSDVFSFGVLLLEIVSGRKNYSFQNEENTGDLASFAWKNWRQGTATNVIDPILRNSSVPSEPAFYTKSSIVSEISRSWDDTEG
ncbi:hypothetical protein ACET3Z_003948 [Daucus carota]